MPDKHMHDYAQRRLEKSASDLESAEILYNAGKFDAAANRAYYSVYHAIRAVLALDDIERKKHSGNISYFRQRYISTDVFDRSYSETIKRAEALRNEADYDDERDISEEKVLDILDKAKSFHNAAKKHISIRIT